MKKTLIITLFLSLFIFANCNKDNSEESNIITEDVETLEPTVPKVFSVKTIDSSNDFKINFIKELEPDNFVRGKMNYGGIQDVNTKIITSENHYEGSTINEMSTGKYELLNLNGKDYILTIESLEDGMARLNFEVENENFTIEVDGSVSRYEFVNFPTHSDGISSRPNIVCGGACIAAVVTIATGAYCAWSRANAADNCTAAYIAAVNAGRHCSMEFESGYCGGDCNINCTD